MSGSGRDARLAIDQLYRDHANAVLRLALRDLGNKADAEDAAQDAFLEAFRALERGNQPRRPREWLLTIVQNVVRRRLRTNRPALGLEGDLLEAREFDALAAREIVEAIAGVPDAQRKVLLLRELCDLSYDEIANRTGMSVPAVQMHLFRARRRFRTEFAPSGLQVPLVLTSWLPRLLDFLRGSPGLTATLPVVAVTAIVGAGLVAEPVPVGAARPPAHIVGGQGARMPVAHSAKTSSSITMSSRHAARVPSTHHASARGRVQRGAPAPDATQPPSRDGSPTSPPSPEGSQPPSTAPPAQEPASRASNGNATAPTPSIAAVLIDSECPDPRDGCACCGCHRCRCRCRGSGPGTARLGTGPPPLPAPQPAPASSAAAADAPVSPRPSVAGVLPQGAPPHP